MKYEISGTSKQSSGLNCDFLLENHTIVRIDESLLYIFCLIIREKIEEKIFLTETRRKSLSCVF